MNQVTLVMLYGPKPSNLSSLITACQEQIAEILGDYFQPYDMHQIHATLVSLGRVPGFTRFNLNFEKYRHRLAGMDFLGLLNFLRLGGRFPFQVQIGGFQNRDYPFVSQGQRPYDRSFSIMDGEGAVALMIGWPIRGKPITLSKVDAHAVLQEGRIYPSILDELRLSFQNFNILHSYQSNIIDVDNDFYFRIGEVHQSSSNYLLRQRAETVIRHFLSTIEPIILEITISDVYVISYQDETLPRGSTKVCSINDSKVTPDFIWDLYKESP